MAYILIATLIWHADAVLNRPSSGLDRPLLVFRDAASCEGKRALMQIEEGPTGNKIWQCMAVPFGPSLPK